MKKFITVITVVTMAVMGAQGDPGNTRMMAFNANFGLYLSRHLSLDLRGSYFWRHAHYRDFEDVDAKTFELRAGLTYKL